MAMATMYAKLNLRSMDNHNQQNSPENFVTVPDRETLTQVSKSYRFWVTGFQNHVKVISSLVDLNLNPS